MGGRARTMREAGLALLCAGVMAGCAVGGAQAGESCARSSDCAPRLACAPDRAGANVCWRACGLAYPVCQNGLRCDVSLPWWPSPPPMLPENTGLCSAAGTGRDGENCANDTECMAGLYCDTSQEWTNAGRCRAACRPGAPCPEGQTCTASRCHPPCDAGTPCADTAFCLNAVCVRFDFARQCQNHTMCPDGQVCIANACRPPTSIPAGTQDVGGRCFSPAECMPGLACDVSTLAMGWGACSRWCTLGPCPTGQICTDGIHCAPPCPTGAGANGVCLNGIDYYLWQVQYCQDGFMCPGDPPEYANVVCRNDNCYRPQDAPAP